MGKQINDRVASGLLALSLLLDNEPLQLFVLLLFFMMFVVELVLDFVDFHLE